MTVGEMIAAHHAVDAFMRVKAEVECEDAYRVRWVSARNAIYCVLRGLGVPIEKRCPWANSIMRLFVSDPVYRNLETLRQHRQLEMVPHNALSDAIALMLWHSRH